MAGRIQITNGQKVRASFDLFDQKDKPFDGWPEGSTIEITGGDSGGATGIAQWTPDASPDNGKGLITTDGDNIGIVTLTARGTNPEGVSFSDTLEVEVVHSPAGSARFTAGEAEPE
ncbi:MAG TPA: hypothetical protein VIV56_07230 [Gemmatimonadales bacterium]